MSLEVPGGAGRTCYGEVPQFHDSLARSGPNRQDKRRYGPGPSVEGSCSPGNGRKTCGNKVRDEHLGSFGDRGYIEGFGLDSASALDY